jgi:hypothetical protein
LEVYVECPVNVERAPVAGGEREPVFDGRGAHERVIDAAPAITAGSTSPSSDAAARVPKNLL